MLDPKFVRDNPDIVRNELKKRGMKLDLDALLEVDMERRKLIKELEGLRAGHKVASDEVRTMDELAREARIKELRTLKEHIAELEVQTNVTEKKFESLISQLPNISMDEVPIGPDESGNVEIRKWGTIPTFDFTVLDHMEIGEKLNVIDTERAVKVSGARFAYLKGKLAILQFAIVQYAFRVLTDEAILSEIATQVGRECPATPFIPVVPPVLIRPEAFARMARLEPREERYHIPGDDLYLVGSAEHTLGSIHMDETLGEESLPLRYVGYSTSFRREAGTYGKDTRGILRVHQFDKIEIESFTTKEDSVREQDFIVAIQEYLVRSLGIPYRVVAICTGDMGTPDARQIDIECWMPSQGCYRETHTSDLNTDYQSRRLNTKVRRKKGTELVHMNDATVFAIGRTMIAIIENYQQADGSVVIPEILRPYCGFNDITHGTR